MSTTPTRVSQPRVPVAARIMAILAVPVFWLPLVAAQDAPKQEHFALDLRKPLDQLSDLSLFGPAVKTIVRTDDQGLHFTVPAGRKNVDVLGVEWHRRLRGDFDVSVGYELIAVGEPLPRYGAGVRLLVWYDAPAALSTALTRSTRPDGNRLVAQRIIKEGDGKEQYLNNKLAKATGPKGRLRMVRAGSRLRFLAAEGGDYQEIQSIDIGTADVRRIQVFCTTHYTPIALEARFTDLDVRADRVLSSTKPPTAPLPVEFTPPQKDYAQEYEQSFQGTAVLPAGWDFVGPGAENCVHCEATGLRISLPSGRGGKRQDTGIKTGFGVQGDFDISLTFEILAQPSAGDSGKAGMRLSLGIWKETQHANGATINRGIDINRGTEFVSWQSLWDEQASKGIVSANAFRTSAKFDGCVSCAPGHTFYGFAEGLDGDSRFRAKYDFGPQELREVRIVASTGGEQAAIEARVTDLRIRADAIPNAPGAAPSRAGRATALLIGGVMLVVIAAALGAAFFLAPRQEVPPTSANEVVKKRKEP